MRVSNSFMEALRNMQKLFTDIRVLAEEGNWKGVEHRLKLHGEKTAETLSREYHKEKERQEG